MKKIKILLPVLVLTIMSFQFFADELSLSYSNNRFQINVPAIVNQKIDGQLPYSLLMLETGDGNFRRFKHGLKAGKINSSWYYTHINNHIPGVHRVTYYDTIKLPKPVFSFRFNEPPPTNYTQNEPVDSMEEDERLKLTALTNVILPGDVLPFVVSYKPSDRDGEDVNDYNKAVIALFYNSEDNPDLFRSIEPSSYLPDNTNGFKEVRLHHNETIKQLEDFESSVKQDLLKLKEESGYQNAIYFETPIGPANIDTQMNIFLTMFTSSDLNVYKSSIGANIMAGLVMVNSSGGSNWPLSYPLGLALRIASRDPNELTISPTLLGPKPQQKVNRTINYELRFENEGGGIAKNISCTLTVPKGIVFPSAALESNRSICVVGGKNYNLKFNNLLSTGTKSKPSVSYQYLPTKRQIVFSFQNINLAGTIEGAGDPTKTEGLVRFQLKTATSVNQIEDCMYSYLSIRFDNNAPVNCEPALLRGSKDATIVCSPLSVFDPRPATR